MSGIPLRVTLSSGTRKTLNDRFTNLQENQKQLRSRQNSFSSQVSVGRGFQRGGFRGSGRGFSRGRGRGASFRGRGGPPAMFNGAMKGVARGRVDRRSGWSPAQATRGTFSPFPRGRGRGRGAPGTFRGVPGGRPFSRGGRGRGRGRGRGAAAPVKKEDLDRQLDSYMQNTGDINDYFNKAKSEDDF